MDELSLADIQTFIRAVALGSLSEVARERDVPVSQISRAIDRMELSCKTALLRRSVRGISLTDEGQEFLQFCHGLHGARQALEQKFSCRKNYVEGRIRVSLSASAAQFWVVPSLPALMSQQPQLCIDLDVNDDVVDLARSGIDIAIRAGSPATLAAIAHTLGCVETGLFASPAYLLKHGVPKNCHDLARHALLSNCKHPVLNKLEFQTGETIDVSSALRAGSTSIIAQLVQQGMGIAHLPVQVARVLGDEVMVPVLYGQHCSADIPIHVIELTQTRNSPRTKVLLQHLKAIFASPVKP